MNLKFPGVCKVFAGKVKRAPVSTGYISSNLFLCVRLRAFARGLARNSLIFLCLASSAMDGQAEPKSLEAAIEQANRALNEGKLHEAEKQAEAALKLYPDK